MLRRLPAVLLAVPLAFAGAALARAHQEETVTVTTFAISGRGWGHGIGMGQYGALGFANHGLTYDRILAHYYRGTTLGPAPVAKVRVLLAEGRPALAIGSDEPFTVRDGTGRVHELGPGSYRFGPGLRLRAPTQTLDEVDPLPGPLTFLPGKAPLRLGRPYRGAIRVVVSGNRLHAVNVVGLDAYVRGVINQEMPDDWPLEALKAQAVAARTYALSQRKSGIFDLYADVRDQVYGGIAAETPAGNEAVVQTRRQVLLHGGEAIVAYFFSTSGGRTAAYTDVFPERGPIPYLVSVLDPYDTLSPYHEWGPVVLKAAQVSRRLRVPGVTDLRTFPAGGRASSVVLLGRDGETTLPARDVRRGLGLRSTWFTAGVLSLARAKGPVASGAAVTLTGFVKDVEQPLLEQRLPGGSWQPGPEIQPAPDGAFSVIVRPPATTHYRLVAGTVRGQALPVVVASP